MEATAAGVASWTDHVKSLGVGLLSNEVNSWMTGINTNVEGKQTRIIARYSGSAPAYRARCATEWQRKLSGTRPGLIRQRRGERDGARQNNALAGFFTSTGSGT